MHNVTRALVGTLLAGSVFGLAGCGSDEAAGPEVGSLQVNLTMEGTDQDTNGGTLVLDGESMGPLFVNVRRTLTDLEPGIYVISVSGIEANCGILGDNPRNATVRAGQQAEEVFRYLCESTGGKDSGGGGGSVPD